MTTDIRITPKKSLGQNFLVNEGVLDRIVAAAGVTASDTVVEIGPGNGALTRRLAATGARVIAVEKDRRLIAPLRDAFAAFPNVTITEGDALRWRPDAVAGSYKVVANIPYYLTARLLRLILSDWPRPALAVLMVQSEVADRLRAVPPDMNLLALSVQLRATPRLVMRVSRGSFRPVPDVDSAVVLLTPRPPAGDEEAVLALAKRAFAHKRKQLKASVPADCFEKAGIPSSRRPQELTTDDWRSLATAFH